VYDSCFAATLANMLIPSGTTTLSVTVIIAALVFCGRIEFFGGPVVLSGTQYVSRFVIMIFLLAAVLWFLGGMTLIKVSSK